VEPGGYTPPTARSNIGLAGSVLSRSKSACDMPDEKRLLSYEGKDTIERT
jgi:hypothetical protein